MRNSSFSLRMSYMELKKLLTPPKTIAVVGLSDKPDRPSYRVASYLREHGFTIIPVNPMIKEFLGIPSYPSVRAIPEEVHIDIVDIFRRSEEVPALVEEVIQTGRRPVIWMQEGVISEEAKQSAKMQSMDVVMDTCLMKSHQAVE